MKKVLIVASTSWSVYRLRMDMIKALRKQNFSVIVCAFKDRYADRIAEQGFRFIPLEIDKKTNLLRDLLLIRRLYKIYKVEKPEFIFHFNIKPNIYGPLAAKLAGVKCACTVTGLGYVFLNKGPLWYLVKNLYAQAFNFCEKVFFQNRDDLGMFVKNKIVDRNKTLAVNGSGVNVNYYSPDFCVRIKKSTENYIFLFASRLLWDKGLKELASASKHVKQKYPNTEFWLLGPAGQGNPKDVPIDTIKKWEREDLIKYFGMVDDIRPYICQSDAVILPSYREGVPHSLLEAMSMERPVIATDTVGCREVVEHNRNGILVPVRNSGAIAEAIIEFIKLDRREKRRMGSFGREKAVREFHQEIINDVYINELNAIMNMEVRRE